MDLVYPFRNFSDALRPGPAAQAAFWGQHGQPVALTVQSAPWKTAFYAFALEALGPDDLAEVLGDTVAWLSPLGDSALAVDLPAAHGRGENPATVSFAEVAVPMFLRVQVYPATVFARLGGLVFAFVTAWIFGREFSDHTAKELLAVPGITAKIVQAIKSHLE